MGKHVAISNKTELRRRIEFGSIPEPNSGCWIWLGTTHGPYGRIVADRKHHRAHRIAAYAFLGLDLSDAAQHACHRCDNPICVNPAHLYVGSHIENMTDKLRRGRQPRGSDVWRARFSEEEILAMVTLIAAGWTVKEVASAYCAVDSTIYGAVIRSGRWDWLKAQHPQLIEEAASVFGQTKHKALRKPVICLTTGDIFASGKDAAECFNLSRAAVCRSCKKDTTVRGLRFAYYEDDAA
jgi:hypothetical protein